MVDGNIAVPTSEIDVEAISEQDVELLLDNLFSHNMEFIQDFLEVHELPYSYPKKILRDKVRDYYYNKELQFEQLVSLLNQIEGWGDQHIYLYTAPSALSEMWRDGGRVRSILERTGHEKLLNRPTHLIIPSETDIELCSIEWSPQKVRFVWIERRIWRERAEEIEKLAQDTLNALVLEMPNETIEWQAYRTKTARGLIAFEWDLKSNEAMLQIHRLPSGDRYIDIKNRIELELQPIVSINSFDKVRVARAVRKLESGTETRRHHMKYRSDNRGTIAVTSPNSNLDVFTDDPVLERTRKALRKDATGLAGRFYWRPVPAKLSCEVYILINGESDDDQRIGILAELREKDVRHVLSRIRHHCS